MTTSSMQPTQTPTCTAWGICGGCGFLSDTQQPLTAEAALLLKEKIVRNHLAPFTVETWLSPVEAPKQFFYRNKMEFAFGQHYEPQTSTTSAPEAPGKKEKPVYVQKEKLRLGLRQQGKFDQLVDVDSCVLLSEESMKILGIVREWAKTHEFSGYDRRRFQGDLRYFVIREGKHTNERMGIFLAGDHCKPLFFPSHTEGAWMTEGVRQNASAPASTLNLAVDSPLYALSELLRPLLSTFWVGFVKGTNDQARSDDMRLMFGKGTIDETLLGLRYRISPFSFFQTNPTATENLYAALQQWAKNRGGVLLDLYCGTGGIGISIASQCDRLVGVDSNKEAIDDARYNAALNGLTNTEFVAQETEDFLDKLDASKLTVQLSGVVVDPPRPGLHPKALTTLIELNPPAIAYVSCNPESLARDLSRLAPLYRIRSVQVFDLFPHTHHVETLVTLEHR